MKLSLTDALKTAGITLFPSFNVGFIKNGPQWFIGHEKGSLRAAYFGDYATGEQGSWTGGEGSAEELAAFARETAAASKTAKEDGWKQVLPVVAREWASFADSGESAYLTKKGIKELYGCKIEKFERGNRLIIPARDAEGLLWGFQRIYSEKLPDIGTDKIFRKGARKEGCFHLLRASITSEPGGGRSLPEASEGSDGAPAGLGPLRLYLCEGFSTAVAVFEALDKTETVVVCFDAGNLMAVSKALRAKYPDALFIYCADNDQWPGKKGDVTKVGEAKALAALRSVGNGHLVLPTFPDRFKGERPTDFDDLTRLCGIDETRRQIEQWRNPSPVVGEGASTPGQEANKHETKGSKHEPSKAPDPRHNPEDRGSEDRAGGSDPSGPDGGAGAERPECDSPPVPDAGSPRSDQAPGGEGCGEASGQGEERGDPSGAEGKGSDSPGAEAGGEKAPKKQKPPEKQVAEILLNRMKGRLVRKDKIVFQYDGRRWVELDTAGIDTLKNALNGIRGGNLPSKEVDSIYRTFLRYMDRVPPGVNPFVPRPDCTNFLDGTLHLRRDLTTNRYTTEFLPHNPEDYLLFVLPLNYQGDRTERNPLLDQLLHDAFEGDPHKEAKISSMGELAGAMLVPAFPQMFFLTGVSGSRKSTLAKTLLKPLAAGGFENVSFVDPGVMEGFQVEGMVGKLVNVNTDIDDHIPFPRGFMKRFEDMIPVQVNRKQKVVVNAILPPVHLYCCNDLPPNFERSKALQRRVTIIDFARDLTNDSTTKTIRYYEDLVYASGARGVINFMLDGLDRLLEAGGNFSPPESSRASLQAWQDATDPLAQFFADLDDNGEAKVDEKTKLIRDKEGSIERSRFWECFCGWAKQNCFRTDLIKKHRVFKGMESRGFPTKMGADALRGIRCFVGLRVGVRGEGP